MDVVFFAFSSPPAPIRCTPSLGILGVQESKAILSIKLWGHRKEVFIVGDFKFPTRPREKWLRGLRRKFSSHLLGVTDEVTSSVSSRQTSDAFEGQADKSASDRSRGQGMGGQQRDRGVATAQCQMFAFQNMDPVARFSEVS